MLHPPLSWLTLQLCLLYLADVRFLLPGFFALVFSFLVVARILGHILHKVMPNMMGNSLHIHEVLNI